jgi:hypothetical protein
MLPNTFPEDVLSEGSSRCVVYVQRVRRTLLLVQDHHIPTALANIDFADVSPE